MSLFRQKVPEIFFAPFFALCFAEPVFWNTIVLYHLESQNHFPGDLITGFEREKDYLIKYREREREERERERDIRER